MDANKKICGIIWDYDGTMVDTRQKNLTVTRQIISRISRKNAKVFPALKSIDSYQQANRQALNWRELYQKEFDLDDKQTYMAGRLWTEYQINDDTPVSLFDGVKDVVFSLGNYPHGIVSMNSKINILNLLESHHMLPYFKSVIGYEEVDIKRQKPEPDGLVFCIENVSAIESGYIFYIGDHESDAECVLNANRLLRKKESDINIMSIAACYASDEDTSKWKVTPDFEVHHTGEIEKIIRGFISS
jgi:HAD superfamily hydrolase (TIGR01549 family)